MTDKTVAQLVDYIQSVQDLLGKQNTQLIRAVDLIGKLQERVSALEEGKR